MTRNTWRPNHAMVKSEAGNTPELVAQRSRAALAALREGGGGGGVPGEQAVRQALGELYKKKDGSKLKVRRALSPSRQLAASLPASPVPTAAPCTLHPAGRGPSHCVGGAAGGRPFSALPQ